MQIPSKNSCYIRLGEVLWDDAQAICSRINGSHVAVANDCEELMDIQNILQQGFGDHFWLGCTDDEDTGIIRCLDNSSSYWNISSRSGIGYWRK